MGIRQVAAIAGLVAVLSSGAALSGEEHSYKTELNRTVSYCFDNNFFQFNGQRTSNGKTYGYRAEVRASRLDFYKDYNPETKTYSSRSRFYENGKIVSQDKTGKEITDEKELREIREAGEEANAYHEG